MMRDAKNYFLGARSLHTFLVYAVFIMRCDKQVIAGLEIKGRIGFFLRLNDASYSNSLLSSRIKRISLV